MIKLKLPTKKGQPNTNPEIEFSQLVVIGANGSGKTRFGSNIEEQNNKVTHRISAQKSLSIPVYVSTKSKEAAFSEFKYGGFNSDNPNWNRDHGWKHGRWNNNLNTSLLNDYEKLMVLLHTEEYEQSLNYKEVGGKKPVTKLDKIQKIFELVLPHRKILKKAGVIETYPTDGNSSGAYNASEMSDGERVVLYLAGEVICAPENSIIIIDEPEMHIHRSLVKNLFDLIEAERSDCSYVYLTHDIDFAFTRQNAVKIWAKSYEGENIWDYEILDDTSLIPEQLFLELLGSRKPILFLEGDQSSLDYEVYEQVYSEYTIKPLGSCEKVIQTVKAFNDQNGFHNLISYGIIDRDRRSDLDVPKLNSSNIWVLDVAEIENIFLCEQIVKVVASYLGKNPGEVLIKVKENIMTFFSSQLDSQILLHFKERLRTSLQNISTFNSKDIDGASTEIDQSYSLIDKKRIYNDIKIEFDIFLGKKDYRSILRVFNLKNALIPQSQICGLLGIRRKEDYFKLIITLLKRKNGIGEEIRKAIDNLLIKKTT